jgi:FKBP-type peptidyl-prolyl cis-trans isomerase (trigger factor)
MAENYAKERGGDIERVLPLYKIFAEQEFKKYYILDKVKQIEPVEVTDSDREAMIAELAEHVGITPEEYKDRYSAQIENEDFNEAIVEKLLFARIRETSKLVKPKAMPEEMEAEPGTDSGESKE